MFSNRNIFLITVVLLVAFMQILRPVPLPTNQVFMALGAVIVLLRAGQGDFKMDMPMMAFMGAIVVSIWGNTIPEFFKPWQRFAQFALLAIAASPMITGEDIDRARRQMTMGVLWSAGIIAVLSFAGYILGFGQYAWGIINGYMGVTGHPNFLGMYVMVAMVWFAALFFRCTENWERITIAGLWASFIIVALLTASRASLASGLIGSLIVVYLRLQRSASKLMTAGFVIAGLVFLSLPYLMPYAEVLLKKGANAEDTEAALEMTRGSIWGLRMLEFNESPWIGVGAFACDINLPYADIFYDANNGSIEQGSSYLGLLAQMGIMGIVIFAIVLLNGLWKAFRYATRQQTPYAQLMLGLMVAIMLHMIFEGYAITAGAVQCVILWFVVGAAYQCDKVADYPVFWESEDPITPEEYEAWLEQKEYEEGV